VEEVITLRVPKGTRARIEKRARARRETLSQYVRRAIAAEDFLDSFEAARNDLRAEARRRGIATDEEAFAYLRANRSRH
jgi:hypothetical protein